MRKIILYSLALFAVLLGAGAWWYLNNVAATSGAVELAMDCGSVGQDFDTCVSLLQDFTTQTGIPVRALAGPQDASLHLSVLRELSVTRSTDMDVYMIDVIWPGILANELIDLRPHFTEADLADFFPALVANNTVGGRLVAVPWFTDAGLLYYRRDLLTKYGFANPPQTWQELEAMAQTIQDGERAERVAAREADPNAADPDAFWGFVWQGRQNEGLTCNALEWLVSEGGGTIVEPDGRISVNNRNAVRALTQAQGWVGRISPPNSFEINEEISRAIWQEGNAAFMRNWPYAFSLGNAADSPVRGLFDVTTLPQGQARSASTLGGWQLAVSRHSRFPQQAAQLVQFMTSASSQKYRAIAGSYNPTRRSLYSDPDVLATNPFFARMPDILNAAVARPSTVTGESYEEVSTVFFTEVNRTLRGGVAPEQAVTNTASSLEALRGNGW